ncbi:hypothetical protein [Nocardiopsis flavescens]
MIIEEGDTFNGPVFGEGATVENTVIAWDHAQVRQTTYRSAEVAPGYEDLARSLTRVLEHLPSSGLDTEENEDAAHSATEILEEVAQDEPNQGRLRRARRSLLQILSPISRGAVSGAEAGAHTWAQEAVEQLSKLPQLGG